MRDGIRSEGLLLLLTLATGGCFRGEFARGLPCADDRDCGPALSCFEGTCGLSNCPVTEAADGSCPCVGSELWSCEEVGTAGRDRVDLLLILDDSGSNGVFDQQSLDSFLSLTTGLATTLEQQSADYRIGVTSTDVGHQWCNSDTTDRGTLRMSTCESRLEDFVFPDEFSPFVDLRDSCELLCTIDEEDFGIRPTTTALDGEARPRAWIEGKGSSSSLQVGTLAEGLACAVPMGVSGCGFEAPLEAMYLALEASEEPGHPNEGFLRDTASLFVIILTNEADCSVNPEHMSAVFDDDGDRPFWSAPESPVPTSAICWNAGVRCSDPEDADQDGFLGSCTAVDYGVNEELTDDPDEAVLYPLDRYRTKLQALRNARADRGVTDGVSLTVFAGLPLEFPAGQLEYPVGDAEFQQGFGVGPVCESSTGRIGLPSVRLFEVAQSVNASVETVHSICKDTFSAATETLQESLRNSVPALCYGGCPLDLNPTEPGIQAECYVGVSTADGTEEVPVCELDAGSEPYLIDGIDRCYFRQLGPAMAPECKDAGASLQISLIENESALPGAVTVNCRPDPDPTACE